VLVISCGGGKWCTRPQSSALARQVTPQETINKLPIRCSREQDERDGNPEWVLMKQIIIPLIFLILIIPSGETTIEYPRENNAPYIDVRTAYQNIDKQFIVLNSKTPENANLSRIRRYDDWLADLEHCESSGREDIVILDTNNRYSYSCLQFQERTFNHYTARYGFEDYDIMNCEHQKDVANEMLKENYNNWRHWFNCSTKKIGLPY
jgi:hypothetical protein